MRSRHDLEPGRRPAPGAERRSRTRGTDSILALQRSAGNRAVTQLLARKAKTARSAPGAAGDDLPLALAHVNLYYDAVRSGLELNDKAHEQAILNFRKNMELKDPPPVGAAIFSAIFREVMGLVPGGKLITAAVTATMFAQELSKLATHLSVDPAEAAAIKKIAGPGTAAVGVAEAAIGAHKEAGSKAGEVSAQEAAIKEDAALQANRISSWTVETEHSYVQQEQIIDLLKAAAGKPGNRGKLEAMVKEWLPRPSLTKKLQDELARRYELALYRTKLTFVNETRVQPGTAHSDMRVSTWKTLELVGGGRPSNALLRHITELLRVPSFFADNPEAIGNLLHVPTTTRTRREGRAYH